MTTEAKVKLKVVDADGHYMEPPSGLAPWIEDRYKDVAPFLDPHPDGGVTWGGRSWFLEGAPGFTEGGGGFARDNETSTKNLLINSGQGEGVSMMKMPVPAAYEPEARLKLLDEESMDAAVFYPTGALTWVPDVDYHHALNRALNDWVAEFCAFDPARLFGVTNIVAIHDVEEACNEVRRCAERHGFKAIFLRTALPSEQARWWSDQYDPLWATCQELDVAVGFHPFPGDSMWGAGRYFDLQRSDPNRIMMRTPFIAPVDAMNTIMGLIVGGITERFPDLRFGMLESGGGWIVPFLERLDNRYDIMSKLPEGLKTIPSEYFKRQWWIAFDPEEVTLPLAVDYIGGDRIIWGSDYPHPDAFYPNFLDMLNENIAGLPHDTQERIRGRNAVDFYKLEG